MLSVVCFFQQNTVPKDKPMFVQFGGKKLCTKLVVWLKWLGYTLPPVLQYFDQIKLGTSYSFILAAMLDCYFGTRIMV